MPSHYIAKEAYLVDVYQDDKGNDIYEYNNCMPEHGYCMNKLFYRRLENTPLLFFIGRTYT